VARADQTGLGVSSEGTYTGAVDAGTYRFAEAAAYTSDVIPLSGLGGTTIQLGWSIDGSASTTGSSQTLTFLNYQLGTGPIFSAFVGETGPNNRAINPLVGAVAGFSVGAGNISGSGFVQGFVTDVSSVTNLDVNIGLFASSYPGPFIGIANNDFYSTAKLTSIILRDAAGNPITFSVVGASGTIYDNNGAHAAAVAAVPEPSSWALILSGFALVGGQLRRRKRPYLRTA
jgi:hypothetical protein